MGFSLKKVFKSPLKYAVSPFAAFSFDYPKESALVAGAALGAGLLAGGAGVAGTSFLPSSASQASTLGTDSVGGSSLTGSAFGKGFLSNAALMAGNAGLSFLGSNYLNNQANKGQQALNDRAFQQNVQMWKMQNEYNSPLAQMQRYAQAGLNPNLIYSQGSSGNATSAPTYIASEYRSTKMNDLMAAFQMKNLNEQNSVLKAQQASLISQAQLNEAKTANQALQNYYLPLTTEAEIDYKYAQTAYSNESQRYLGEKMPIKNQLVHGVKKLYAGLGEVQKSLNNPKEVAYRKALLKKYGHFEWRKHYGEKIKY